MKQIHTSAPLFGLKHEGKRGVHDQGEVLQGQGRHLPVLEVVCIAKIAKVLPCCKIVASLSL